MSPDPHWRGKRILVLADWPDHAPGGSTVPDSRGKATTRSRPLLSLTARSVWISRLRAVESRSVTWVISTIATPALGSNCRAERAQLRVEYRQVPFRHKEKRNAHPLMAPHWLPIEYSFDATSSGNPKISDTTGFFEWS